MKKIAVYTFLIFLNINLSRCTNNKTPDETDYWNAKTDSLLDRASQIISEIDSMYIKLDSMYVIQTRVLSKQDILYKQSLSKTDSLLHKNVLKGK